MVQNNMSDNFIPSKTKGLIRDDAKFKHALNSIGDSKLPEDARFNAVERLILSLVQELKAQDRIIQDLKNENEQATS